MLSLGSWASMNIVGSGIGWARSNSEENKYFHQMNVMWSLVNLGLAIPGYIKAKQDNSVTAYTTFWKPNARQKPSILGECGY